jgi:alpha-N-arabinofuranosidase
MDAAGVDESRIALTELQLFPYPEDDREAPVPTNKSVSEVTYNATFVHASVRSDTVEMITHSGIGNHGASVQKRKERVFPDPRHHYQRMGPALFGGTPLGVTLACGTFDTETTYNTESSDLFGEIHPSSDVPVVDPLAVETDDGVIVDLIHRDASADAVDVTVEVPGAVDGEATVTTITADEMDASNSLEDPDNVSPAVSMAAVEDGSVQVALPPLSVVRVELDG